MADLPDEKGNASAQDVPPQQLTPGPQTGASHKSSEGAMPQCSHETIKEKTVVHDVAPEHESPHEDTDDDTHDDHDTDDESHASSDAPNVRVSTRSSSTHSRPVSIIPRFKRRGLLGSLTIVPEVDRPYDYSRNTKWMLTCVVSLAGAVAPFGSSIFYRASGSRVPLGPGSVANMRGSQLPLALCLKNSIPRKQSQTCLSPCT